MPQSDPSIRASCRLACFIAFQVAVLTAIPTMLSTSPMLDVVEGWTWAPHWLIGTYKHPPMPAWCIQLMHYVTPGFLLGPYLLSQIAVGLTYLFVYLTGLRLMDRRRALAGTLLLAGSFYFTYPTIQFNHNVIQMPFWAAIILTFACILKSRGRTVYWLALGCLFGAGMYAKYSVAVIALVALLAAFAFPPIRRQFRTFRPYLTIVLSIAIFSPHMLWLVDNDFLPFRYAADKTRNDGSLFEPLQFLLAQLADHTPMLILLAGVGIPALRAAQRRQDEPDSLLFLRIFSFGPLLLLIAVALLTRKTLLDMWGMPMFTPVGLWAVAELRRDWTKAMISRLTVGAVAMVSIAASVVVGEAIWSISHKPSKEFWPLEELTAKANAIWTAEVSKPLEITGGDIWLSGLVSIGLPQRPDVAAGDDLRNAPWVTAADVAQKGMLYFSRSSDFDPPPYCAVHGPIREIKLDERHLRHIYAMVCLPNSASR